MQINKDTKLFGSFSSAPGNNGCNYFNSRFKEEGKNAIYKSFYGDNAVDVAVATKILKFTGYALSMPLKVSILNYLDDLDIHAAQIGAANTVVLQNGKYVGYNTDWYGVQEFFIQEGIEAISIIGNGGFSKAIQYCCKVNDWKYEVFDRINIGYLDRAKYKTFNATPADFICDYDGRPNSETGRIIAQLQAAQQYKLYEKEI